MRGPVSLAVLIGTLLVALLVPTTAAGVPRDADTVHARKVRIWIDDAGVIHGRVRVPDGYDKCAAGQSIGIYWQSYPYWYGPGRGSPYYFTDAKGRFSGYETGNASGYKAKVYADTIGNHECKGAFSNVVAP